MKPTAFTIGNAQSYDAALRQPQPLHKLGRYEREGEGVYEGGAVFRTEADALAYLSKHPELPYKVYGLVLPTSWAEDVRECPGADFHHLLHDAQILSLEKPL